MPRHTLPLCLAVTLAPLTAAPLAAQDLPPALVESHIFFTDGGSTLDGAAEEQIARLAAVLETGPMRTACLKLVGHADSSGPAGINETVGLERARAVAAALSGRLSRPGRIEAVTSAGETAPLALLPATDPRQRRVAILARTCPPATSG